jgi:hypothetical protein
MVGRDSVFGIATFYGLDGPGSNPGGDENFRTLPDPTRGHLVSCTMGAGSLSLTVNRPGGRVNHHPPQSSAKVKERVELYLCSSSGCSGPVIQ